MKMINVSEIRVGDWILKYYHTQDRLYIGQIIDYEGWGMSLVVYVVDDKHKNDYNNCEPVNCERFTDTLPDSPTRSYYKLSDDEVLMHVLINEI